MKITAAVVSGASIVALSLAVAGPASAAGNAIDPGDSLYAINCDDVYNDWQLFSVDSTTAFSTPIGVGTDDGIDNNSAGCAAQPAYNPATGKSYYVQWSMESVELATIDVATGVSTTIGGFYYDNGEFPEYIEVDALAIGADGSAFVLAEGTLWSVDLDTAWVTPIGETEGDIYAFAFDSVTSKFYGISYLNEIFEIDVTDGTATPVGEVVSPEPDGLFRVYSLQFDEAGTFWVEVDSYGEGGDGLVAELWSFTLPTAESPVYSGVFTDDPFYTEAILIIPGDVPVAPLVPVAPVEPALAATGADPASVLPWGIGAAVIVLAGGVLLTVRSRRETVMTTSSTSALRIEKH